MTFYAFGLNHETAPLAVREVYALNADQKRVLLSSLDLSEHAEMVLLSTCNRTEAYLYGTAEDLVRVEHAIAGASGHVWPSGSTFCKEDEAAVEHVLEVASGLKSMVIGDVQILAQMKEAYRIAVETERVGTVLHRLMHTAFRSAKHVLNGTDIGSGSASVSSASVALARAHFDGSLAHRTVVVIGTGEVGRLVLHALVAVKPAEIVVVNRSLDQAERVHERFNVSLGTWEERHALIAASDVAIVATASSDPVIKADGLPSKAVSAQETLLIDLSVPRNVDPAVEALPGYHVLDMDALESWTREVEAARRLELPKAAEIVREELSEFVSWMLHQQALQPAIAAIRETFEQIRLQEIERHHHRFTDADREDLDHLTRSMMQKLLAVPIVRLKASDPDSVDLVRGVRLLQSFFTRPGCEDNPSEAGTRSDEEAQPPATSDEAQAEVIEAGSRAWIT